MQLQKTKVAEMRIIKLIFGHTIADKDKVVRDTAEVAPIEERMREAKIK